MSNGIQGPVDADKALRVRRGRVDSVDLYEIKDSELDLLEMGSPANLQLNFAIFVLSLAFSAICTLCTAEFRNARIETLFVVVAVVGVLLGVFLLTAWFRTRASVANLCAAIRRRMPPDAVREAVPPQPAEVVHDPTAADNDPAG